MPALNFQKRFVAMIENGDKANTIRRVHKSRPIVAGDDLFLYSGMRTSSCKRIGFADCLRASKIIIERDCINLSGSVIFNLNRFARQEGFKDYREMRNWFDSMYGLPFEGVFIEWTNFRK